MDPLARRRFLQAAALAVATSGCSRINMLLESSPEHDANPTRFVADPPVPWGLVRDPLTVTWIGHSTFLIRLDGTTILTDPAFGSRIGVRLAGMVTVGLSRLVPPALPLRELPPVDLVLLSHAHMDHYDLGTLRRLPRDVPIILASDTTEFVDGFDFTSLQELHWGESAEVKGVHIEAVRVRHWGKRYPWDRDRGYNGYVLRKGPHTIFFGGDTAYTEHVGAALAGRRLDVVFLPIGSYNPWISNHASPEDAWRMFRAVEARYFVPMHWRTFRLSKEPTFEPMERLWAAAGPLRDRIAIERIGDTWTLDA
ncbi:MAG TPA: MBL fold metallo-hydrolase [Candidatus Methylomirabilis sp.]|jgi:L-ascorbate metabolism protein UlaG (beta-lactamase superfamily)